jgi:hypothetical protein
MTVPSFNRNSLRFQLWISLKSLGFLDLERALNRAGTASLSLGSRHFSVSGAVRPGFILILSQ